MIFNALVNLKDKMAWKKLFERTSYSFCVIMVIYQVSDSLDRYFSDNPTYPTLRTRSIQPEDLPSIQLCPSPAWNMDLLNSAGYRTPGNLLYGEFECSSNDKTENQGNIVCPPGWNGKYGNVTYKKLGLVNMTDIVKKALIGFADENINYEYQTINPEDVSVKYLKEGNCFGLDLGKYITHMSIKKLVYIDIFLKMNANITKKLDFHVEDTNQAYFYKNAFDLVGSNIEYRAKNSLWKTYKLKIAVQKNMEEDSKADCSHYGKGKTFESYGQCRQEEARSYVNATIGCIPPMLLYKNESSYY